MLQHVYMNTGIEELAVEKDWWVTITLKALFATSFSKFLRFKGGTSLSKVWKEINLQRFSEDIDITISRDWFTINEERRKEYPFASCNNNNQIKLLRKASRKAVFEMLAKELADQLCRLDVKDFNIEQVTTKKIKGEEIKIATDEDPTIINVCYDSILSTKNEYIQPKVKIEISCLSMDDPYEVREITSLVYDSYKDEDAGSKFSCPTILPIRTFIEKALLLNEEYQKHSPRSERMTRHLYDLEKMMDKYAIEALSYENLYETLIEHRKRFYHVGAVDYTLDRRENIKICPPNELSKDYQDDYAKMRNSFIYDKNPLSYDKLIERLSNLETMFHQQNYS